MPTLRSRKETEVVIHIDGASRGNPGPAAFGVLVEGSDGTRLAAFSKFLGRATNNEAEYQALLAALDHAREHGYRSLKVLSDSELLVRQIEGAYKVKSPGLKPLHQRVRRAIAGLEAFRILHVPREQNRESDRLANRALDRAAMGETAQSLLRKSDGPQPQTIRASATYTDGALRPDRELPLEEGEAVDVEIRRKS